jgi:hypothetical protein
MTVKTLFYEVNTFDVWPTKTKIWDKSILPFLYKSGSIFVLPVADFTKLLSIVIFLIVGNLKQE